MREPINKKSVTREAIRRVARAAARRVRRIAPRLSSLRADDGMSTAEYAIGTIAACAFAALLYKVVTSGQVFDLLSGLVSRALHVPF